MCVVIAQAALHREIDPVNIQPEIRLDLSAWTTIANLEMHGYVRVGE